MYHLKTFVTKSSAIKQQLTKVLPATTTLISSRNYADHQIPDRLKDVETAKGKPTFTLTDGFKINM